MDTRSTSAGRRIVLLDLDGTLVQSHPGILASIRYACGVLGMPVPEQEELNRFIGPPIVESMERNGVTGSDLVTAVEAYRTAYATPQLPDPSGSGDLIPGMYIGSVYDGIFSALRDLHSCGYILAIATAKPQPQAEPVCKHFGLDEAVDALYGASLDPSRRHKADVIRYAFEGLNYSEAHGDRAVMVGDRWTDVDGASEVGLDTIGVRWGYAEAGELESHGAVAFAEKTSDLADVVDAYFAQ